MSRRRLLLLAPLTAAVGALLVPLAVQPAQGADESSTKRGIASAKYLKTYPDKLTAAGATWSYNWTYRVPASSEGLQTVPMLRSAAAISETAIQTLTAGRINGDYQHLLGFNEPDSKNQAAMTPAQAANLWPKLQRTGLILGSPAPAVPTNGWLREFMQLAAKKKLRVDFIALHFYARIDDDRALSRIKTQIELIRRNYNKPIWVTEIGIIDRRKSSGSTATNWARAKKFMRSVTAMLDAMPYVHRYAWMADNVSQHRHLRWSTLYDSAGRLTPLGEAYAALD